MTISDADRAALITYRNEMYDLGPTLDVYLGSMETKTSDNTTQVTVDNVVRKVMSVWLATDTSFEGTNYYAEPKADDFVNVDVKVIPLDTVLPGAATSVVVAYYQDCPVCGWDPDMRAARDPGCATCGGTGMVLALGSPTIIPVKRIPKGGYKEGDSAFGEETEGKVVINAKGEHVTMLKAAIRLVFDDQLLIPYEDQRGAMKITHKTNLGGVNSAVRVETKYEDIQ